MPDSAPAAVASLFSRSDGMEVVDYRCSAGPGSRPSAEVHDLFSIALVRRGFFGYTTEGRTHVLTPGALLLGNPGAEYVCSHEYGCGDDCTSFQYPAEVLEEIASAHGLRAWRDRFSVGTLPAPLRAAAIHAEIWDATDLGIEEASYRLAAVVMHALAGRAPEAGRTSAADRERAVNAYEFLQAHHADSVGLHDVASSVGLSPYHFLRTFRRAVGVSPHQALVRMRLQRAIQMLREVPDSVTDIAYAVGFGDLSNFVRTFHREVGLPPQAFRSGAHVGNRPCGGIARDVRG